MFDNTHVLKDDGAITSSGYGEVDASAKVVNLGSGLVRLNLVIHISAIKCSAGDEKYEIHLMGGSDESFTQTVSLCSKELGAASSLKIGRQPLSYDDQRILGGLGWAQQARTHDAAVYKYKKEKFSLDIGGALNTTTDEVYDTSSLFSYRDMAFFRANSKGEKFNISFWIGTSVAS